MNVISFAWLCSILNKVNESLVVLRNLENKESDAQCFLRALSKQSEEVIGKLSEMVINVHGRGCKDFFANIIQGRFQDLDKGGPFITNISGNITKITKKNKQTWFTYRPWKTWTKGGLENQKSKEACQLPARTCIFTLLQGYLNNFRITLNYQNVRIHIWLSWQKSKQQEYHNIKIWINFCITSKQEHHNIMFHLLLPLTSEHQVLLESFYFFYR